MEKRDRRDRRQTSRTRAAQATPGAEASARWLEALGLPTIPKWHAEISLGSESGAGFELDIYAEEWGFVFHVNDRTSWIRVTDIPFVHGRDDFELLSQTPDLLEIGGFIVQLERAHSVSLPRAGAVIRTNIPDGEPIVREWLSPAAGGAR